MSFLKKQANSRAGSIIQSHLQRQAPTTPQPENNVQFRQPEATYGESKVVFHPNRRDEYTPPEYSQSQSYQPQKLPHQIQQQQQPEHQYEEVAQKQTEITVIQKFNPSQIRVCLIIGFLITICVLVGIIATSIHSSFEKRDLVRTSGVHIAWTNTSDDAQKTSQIYSVYYSYTISEIGEWERLPSDAKQGIPGVTPEDFTKIISIHSCCQTVKRFMVCSNSNRIDGTTFDIRLIGTEEVGIFLEVYSVNKLLIGARCTLEMELLNPIP
jgi:hypothetical protein